MLKKKEITLLTISIAMIIFGVGYFFIATVFSPTEKGLAPKNNEPVEVVLEFWGLWDNSDNWQEIIEKFKKETFNFGGQKINVSVNYTKKEYGSYREDLVKAKEKNGEPDIFMINNKWLEKYVADLEPLSEDNVKASRYNLIKYEELLDIFPTETIRDLIYSNKLYGLPTYSDSLALYYNKDLFAAAEIENPPRTWNDFKKAVIKLTELNTNNDIAQSGVAFGCGRNINSSADILSLLMMQGGAAVIDADKNIDINKEIDINTISGSEKRMPGKRAILFYSEFSDPKKGIYAWNCSQEEAIKMFAHNKIAMFVGYSYQIKNLLVLNPTLSFGVSPMPQLENSTVVNFSNVWTPVVSKNNNCQIKSGKPKSEIDCANLAWSFLSFVSKKENAEIYLTSAGKTGARKDIIEEQIGLDNEISVFALQAETAVSYNKFDDEIDKILIEMIDEINLNRDNLDEIVDKAVGKIEELKNNLK